MPPEVQLPNPESLKTSEPLKPAEPRNGVDVARSISPFDPRLAWASERTLLAWIRTGIGMMAFGFVLARFGLVQRTLGLAGVEADSRLSWLAGGALVVVGVVVNAAGTFRYVEHQRALRRGEHPVPSLMLPVGVGVGVAAVGLALVAMLFAGER